MKNMTRTTTYRTTSRRQPIHFHSRRVLDSGATVVVTLRDEGRQGVPLEIRLRRFLKFALRSANLRCVDVSETPTPAQASTPHGDAAEPASRAIAAPTARQSPQRASQAAWTTTAKRAPLRFQAKFHPGRPLSDRLGGIGNVKVIKSAAIPSGAPATPGKAAGPSPMHASRIDFAALERLEELSPRNFLEV